jgi:hypothetical protein
MYNTVSRSYSKTNILLIFSVPTLCIVIFSEFNSYEFIIYVAYIVFWGCASPYLFIFSLFNRQHNRHQGTLWGSISFAGIQAPAYDTLPERNLIN